MAKTDIREVFRGCVAMAYPDLWAAGRDPDTQHIPSVEETIPFDRNWRRLPSGNPMIHFDLDPQNGKFESLKYLEKSENFVYARWLPVLVTSC